VEERKVVSGFSAEQVVMKIVRLVPLVCALIVMAPRLPFATAQEPARMGSSSTSASSVTRASLPTQPVPSYVRPTEKTKLHNYLFDSLGPYPVVGATIAAGISQAGTDPPEWGQDADGFGKRFASSFGIAAISTTTRYGMAEALGEDTLYYQCGCRGVFRRLKHAVISTVTARRGNDGHREFSVSAVVLPYVGSMTAVYGWYPDRYGYKDAFRMGNYTLLWNVAQNIATEFVYGGPHSVLSRFHLTTSTGSWSN
jgi:hypothetical protein